MLQFLSEVLWWNVSSEMFRPKCVKVIDRNYKTKLKTCKIKLSVETLLEKLKPRSLQEKAIECQQNHDCLFWLLRPIKTYLLLAQRTRNSTTFSEIKLSVTFLTEKVKPKSLEEKEDEYPDRLGNLYHFGPFWTIRTPTEGSKNKTVFRWEVSLQERTAIWVLDANIAADAFWELLSLKTVICYYY